MNICVQFIKQIKVLMDARAELTRISLQYGVAIKSIGNLMIGDIHDIEYSNDPESGDLYPEILRWKQEGIIQNGIRFILWRADRRGSRRG